MEITFLAKMYQVENWPFLFVEVNVSYSYDHDKTKEYEYHFEVKSQLKIYQFIEWIGLKFS